MNNLVRIGTFSLAIDPLFSISQCCKESNEQRLIHGFDLAKLHVGSDLNINII